MKYISTGPRPTPRTPKRNNSLVTRSCRHDIIMSMSTQVSYSSTMSRNTGNPCNGNDERQEISNTRCSSSRYALSIIEGNVSRLPGTMPLLFVILMHVGLLQCLALASSRTGRPLPQYGHGFFTSRTGFSVHDARCLSASASRVNVSLQNRQLKRPFVLFRF
jgi:hypothetical protein